MTVLHAGGKFDKGSYKVSGGLHGVGISCVNALSSALTATVCRNGKIYQQHYSKGAPLDQVTEIGTTDKQGTIIEFLPDDSIFTQVEFSYDIISLRLRELAYLNKGLTLNLVDKRSVDENGNFKTETFLSEGGLVEFVNFLDKTRTHIIPSPIFFLAKQEKFQL